MCTRKWVKQPKHKSPKWDHPKTEAENDGWSAERAGRLDHLMEDVVGAGRQQKQVKKEYAQPMGLTITIPTALLPSPWSQPLPKMPFFKREETHTSPN